MIVQHLGHAIRQEASVEGGGGIEEGGVAQQQPHTPEASTPSHSSSGSGSTEKRQYAITTPSGIAHAPPTKEEGLNTVTKEEEEEEVVVVAKKATAVAAKMPSVEEVRTFGQSSSEAVTGSKEARYTCVCMIEDHTTLSIVDGGRTVGLLKTYFTHSAYLSVASMGKGHLSACVRISNVVNLK